MSNATKSPRSAPTRPAKRSGGGGGFWLLLAAVVLGIGGVYVFAPDLPRQWFGTTKPPADKGAEPTATQQVKTDLANKTHKVDDDLSKPKVATAAEKPKVDAQPVPEKPTAVADEAKAQPILEAAQKAYTEMKWSKAANEARKITTMAVSAATRIKAQDIVAGSAAIEKLFNELNDKDELTRYYDTHPSLVLLKSGTGTTLAVPIPRRSRTGRWITSRPNARPATSRS
jgi:cytoskeletal protein RodZ